LGWDQGSREDQEGKPEYLQSSKQKCWQGSRKSKEIQGRSAASDLS